MPWRKSRFVAAWVVLWVAWSCAFWVCPAAAEGEPHWLDAAVLEALFPGAIYSGPLEGEPSAAAVYGPGEKIGYVFATSDIVDTVGFSGASFTLVVGLDIDGVMAGAKLVSHAEPIIEYNTLGDALTHYTGQYAGLDYVPTVRVSGGGQTGEIDGISSATISARAFHHAIIQSARMVAHSRGLRAGGAFVTAVNTLSFEPAPWAKLLDSGAVARLRVMDSDLAPADAAIGSDPEPVIDLYAALLNPLSIGRNLLSPWYHSRYVATYSPHDLIILIMANGRYSFVGKQVFYTGTFDRIRIAQDDNSFPLVRALDRYRYLPFITSEGAPDFSQVGLFRLPAASGIDVLKPWDLVLTVRDGDEPESTVLGAFSLPYALPAQFVLPPAQPDVAEPQAAPQLGWWSIWRSQASNIAVLLAALTLLSVALIKMHWLTRRPRVYQLVRIAFLTFTLVWVGWIAGAQLSIINPLTWLQAIATGHGWEAMLFDPLICVLAVFTLASLFVWGRGAFCGWLCPFGALQELLSRLARGLRVPQLTLSYRVHRLLWPVKYAVLASVVAASVHGAHTLGVAAEIEPFKTVITLRLERAWPFVLYGLALLLAGLFFERAFCRFICPLGALLALAGKFRILGTLKRREQCGSPCQLCRKQCPIQAIAPSGEINMSECFYCLDCQVIYHDQHRCPPLVARAKRAARQPIHPLAVSM